MAYRAVLSLRCSTTLINRCALDHIGRLTPIPWLLHHPSETATSHQKSKHAGAAPLVSLYTRRGFSLSPSPLAAASSAGDAAGSPGPFKLIIYSKEECHLCDGLKEKVQALIDRAAFMPSILSGVELEIRDIESNSEWQAAFSMTIPVLAAADVDGSNERELPRPSPRMTADSLEKHIAKHLAA